MKLKTVKDLSALFTRLGVDKNRIRDEKVVVVEEEEEVVEDVVEQQQRLNDSPRVDGGKESDSSSTLSPLELMEQAEALAVRMRSGSRLNSGSGSGSTSDRETTHEDTFDEKKNLKQWEKNMRDFESSRGPAGLDSSEDPVER